MEEGVYIAHRQPIVLLNIKPNSKGCSTNQKQTLMIEQITCSNNSRVTLCLSLMLFIKSITLCNKSLPLSFTGIMSINYNNWNNSCRIFQNKGMLIINRFRLLVLALISMALLNIFKICIQMLMKILENFMRVLLMLRNM